MNDDLTFQLPLFLFSLVNVHLLILLLDKIKIYFKKSHLYYSYFYYIMNTFLKLDSKIHTKFHEIIWSCPLWMILNSMPNYLVLS